MILVESWKKYLTELESVQGLESSFQMKDSLQPDFWKENDLLDSDIADRLYEIAKDFFDSLGLAWVDIVDIVITGSIANYNWSQFSDIDLHIIVDYDQIDENQELVNDYLLAQRMRWNRSHNIMIKGYEVEVYVEDSKEDHVSTGVYSIIKDEWVKKPEREDVNIDWGTVEKKAETLMNEIDAVYSLFEKGEYEDAEESASRMKEKIRKFRKAGLDDAGQYSPENIAFKVLRRNEYLKKLSSLRIMAYDKKMSLKEE